MDRELSRRKLLQLTAAGAGAGALGPLLWNGVAAQDKIVIGFSQRRVAGSDWYKTLILGAEEEAKKGGAEIVVLDANGDTAKQNSDVRTLITRQVKAVIMNPSDPTGVGPAVNALAAAKIPLVVVNSNLDPALAPKAACYVAEDQIATAAKAGRAIAKEVEQRFGRDESVKAVVVGGYSGEVVTELRMRGFLQGYAEYFDPTLATPGAAATVVASGKVANLDLLPVRYGEWLPDKALPQVRDVATANPDLKLVYSESDVMLPGILSALESTGMTEKAVIASYDGQMSVLKMMIDNPNGPVQADASNEPYKQGSTAVQMAIKAVRGELNPEVDCPGGNHFIDTFIATPETAQQFYDPNRTF